MSKNSVITAIARTPIGSFQGALSTIPTVRLGAAVIKSAVERSGLKGDQVDEVIMGNVLSAGEGQATTTTNANGGRNNGRNQANEQNQVV